MNEPATHLGSTQRPTVPILTYHSVNNDAVGGFESWTIGVDKFANHLAYLDDAGYKTCTVEQLATAYESASRGESWNLGNRTVAITFDDAIDDFCDAWRLLRRRSMTATLYVPTGFIAASTSWLPGAAAVMSTLTWPQLRELVSGGVSVGAHGDEHLEMDRVSGEQLRREAQLPKDILEDRLQLTIRTFAYPYGYYDRESKAAILKAGYTSACAVDDRISAPSDDPLRLPRHSIRPWPDVIALQRLLEGRPRRGARAVTAVKRVAWRTARRVRS